MDLTRYKVFPVSNHFTIQVDVQVPLAFTDQKLASEVDTCWESQIRHGSNLYDGLIFSVNTLTTKGITGSFVPYRYYVAWRRRPELHAKIPIKPLCVSGITHTNDEVLVGRRASHVHLFPEHYEFAPSGSVDKESEIEGFIDYCGLVARELQEETGILSKDIERIQLFAVIEDCQEESLELCFDIRLKKSFSNMQPTDEYSALLPWKKSSLDAFLERQSKDWVPFSKYLWEQWKQGA